MKSAYIVATFPELKGRNCHQDSRGSGSTKKVAISRAFAALFKKVSRYKFQTIACTIQVVDAPEEGHAENTPTAG